MKHNKKKTNNNKALTKGQTIKAFVHAKAKELRDNTPKSELWFYDIIGSELLKQFKLNEPLGKGIPDLHSKSLRIVIEIDGSIHWNNPIAKQKDDKRTKEYQSYGYDVFRINHLDVERALQVIDFVKVTIERRRIESIEKADHVKKFHSKKTKQKKVKHVKPTKQDLLERQAKRSQKSSIVAKVQHVLTEEQKRDKIRNSLLQLKKEEKAG